MEIGLVMSVIDGIARLIGLETIFNGEVVEFDSGVYGIILNLESTAASAAIFSFDDMIQQDDVVERSFTELFIKVSFDLVGRVIDPAGNFLD